MPPIPVIAILDIGKTNKKLFLFDEIYNKIWEESSVLTQTKDEDGDPCEDLDQLNAWICEVLNNSKRAGNVEIRAINFSAYGASFVHIDEYGKPLTPLYSYLKPFPEKIKKQFYEEYGGEQAFCLLTSSPVLDSLNSGMQIYRIKIERPDLFRKIKYSLHLPQYLSWIFSGKACADITSIGCHTNLWNFSQNDFHEWVYREDVIDKMAPLLSSGTAHPVAFGGNDKLPEHVAADCIAGIGLHDSSAAMIPYLESFREPFILISSGTWCISMNPFNRDPLTSAELEIGCLCYFTFEGRPVKASRLFAGHEHERQLERLRTFFHKNKNGHHSIGYNPEIIMRLKNDRDPHGIKKPASLPGASVFGERELSVFSSYEEAYHRLMMDIMTQQVISTKLILKDSVKRIFVDGGFGKNEIYMHLLADAFPEIDVYGTHIAQASAMGAAMAIREHWNTRRFPEDMIGLKYYSAKH